MKKTAILNIVLLFAAINVVLSVQDGYVEYIKAGQTQGDMLLPVPEGAFAVRLGEDASIKTRVTNTMYSSDGWDSYSWGFLAQANEIEIMLHNPAVEKDPACGPLIDFLLSRL
ncbi:hypothetical protein HAX54_008562 [Datura stramonium]|uniref:DUF642 domain-containing protein n=1 Tax=Datura stramonium TaxID=4076 RepID=A0ABS8RZ20_DATST|nr:hypothetical protein [Datura stramonium]